MSKEPEVNEPEQVESNKGSMGETEEQLNKAIMAKRERTKRLEEFKELTALQLLMKDFEARPEEMDIMKDKCEKTFHIFVSSHEKYMQYEDDVHRREIIAENYDNQRDAKLQLDYMVDLWQRNRERYRGPPSESRHSSKSMRSRGSGGSSRSSVRERRRSLEEAKLRMQTLKDKQEIERQLELAEQSKTELSRKLKFLEAEAKLKQAEIDYVLDQIPEDEEIRHDPEEDALQVDSAQNQPIPVDTEIPKRDLCATAREFQQHTQSPTGVTLPEQQERPAQPQLDVWNTIAQAIKEGPSLPKIELMRYSGDPLEYVEFMTNFKDNIEAQVSDESQRFTRLLAQCVGKAKEAIRSCVNLKADERYKEAKKCLHENFGQSHMIVEAHMKKLRELQVRKSDATTLMEFVRHLEDSYRALKTMGYSYSSRLDNEDTIVMLMRKLPDESLKRKWADRAGDIIKTKGTVQFDDFVQFLKKISQRINNRFGKELKQHNEDSKLPNKPRFDPRRRVSVNAVRNESNEEETQVRTSRKCPQCSGLHGIWRCKAFKSSDLRSRLRIVKQHRLCRTCLDEGHFARSCKSGFTCRVNGCGKDHHYLLHGELDTGKDNTGPKNQIEAKDKSNEEEVSTQSERQNQVNLNMLNPEVTEDQNQTVNVGAVEASRPRVCFKVVPVKVSSSSSGKEVVTHAFLDGGSDTTLCLQSLIQDLAVEDAKPVQYMMTTVNSQQQKTGYEVQLSVESIVGGDKFQLDGVLTTDNLPVTLRHVATNNEVQKWPHLQDIVLPETGDKQVTILIGSDRPDLIDNYIDRRDGERGEPCAVKTPLGWTVYGPMGESEGKQVSINFTRSESDALNQKLEKMYNAEFQDLDNGVEESMSVEDRYAEEIMSRTTAFKDGHYRIGLPFKRKSLDLPNSRPMAEKRLESLKWKMQRDQNFRQKYSSVMKKYQEEGASKEVTDEELKTLQPLWYLPHHAVWHPRKPEEPRVVFDCASKADGVSLNDQLLRGPENTSTLIGVILRFRVDNVAVTADVKRMFHQVHVISEHRGALCYLWWPDGDISKAAKTYQMLVHIFGAKSSPSVAGYALRRTAKDNVHDHSEAATDAVLRDFYVDDLLKSFPDEEEAKSVSKELQCLLAKGGFQLTKWNSNSREVLEEFPVENRAPVVKNLDLESEILPMDRALGVHWDVERDTIKLVVSDKKEPNNRKGVLSSIATVYDPLGFASPLILPAREINQELCRLKFDWSRELPKELSDRWTKWKEELRSLDKYEIPRCFKPKDFGPIQQVELHHFADASQEHGYGTVSYLRLINERGEIRCSFVMGKSRVKPLNKAITVPKLELTAATLATRINKIVVRELRGRLNIDRVMFWTDSMIVLKYIANEKRRFVTFVANRVAVIRQESSPEQWRHVRSEINPADYASRGIQPSETEKLECWRRGPEFLWQPMDQWPDQPEDLKDNLPENAEGVKREKVLVSATAVQDEFWSSLYSRFSTWERLRRVVAWLMRVRRKRGARGSREMMNRGAHDDTGGQCKFLSVAELREAERKIVQQVQREAFPNVVAMGKKGSLAQLKPFEENGILRVGGRLSQSNLSDDAKHPIIMPKNHRVSELIILHHHRINGHVGSYQTLAKTRERFWITNGASYVKRVLASCQTCRRENARLGEQVMAPLPSVRVSSDRDGAAYPFEAVGVDYFGPLYVKIGRRTRAKGNQTLGKRFGCIFTCLKYRAVHIEVADDLSSDSFINAVLRFIGRRGAPRVIYSDNGTNFKGAEEDVVEAMKSWDEEKIQGSLSRRGVQWVFNPPGASHQGGVWERLIRSTKKILRSLVGQRELNDESLRTFLVEVEKIMNDRPITPVSSDPKDLEALTPNHILLLRQNPSTSAGEFESLDKFKARWKHVQMLADTFWERWTREYLPTLQETQKWLKKMPNFGVGDLVLMVDKDVPRGQWPKALVEQVFPDSEGVVRRVTVRTSDGVYQRDVRKLCLLEERLLS